MTRAHLGLFFRLLGQRSRSLTINRKSVLGHLKTNSSRFLMKFSKEVAYDKCLLEFPVILRPAFEEFLIKLCTEVTMTSSLGTDFPVIWLKAKVTDLK